MDFSLLESVPDAILIVDGAGRIAFANGQAHDLFGFAPGALPGRAIEELVPERYRPGHEDHRLGYQAAPRTRSMGAGRELAGRRRDGSEFPAEISLSPVRTPEGVLAIAAVRDLTERKRTEEAARLYRQAQEEVRVRDEFISIAAHELRTPVTALHVQIQVLQRFALRGGPGVLPMLAPRLQALESQVRQMEQMVEDLLDVSRIRLGRLELRLDDVDLVEIARAAAAPYQADPSLGRGSVVGVRAGGPVWARVDRTRMVQVVGNLLGNAVKFGEGRPVDLELEAVEGRATLRVIDRGGGVRPEDRERIFGQFERAAPAANFGGLGLGLFVVQQIVEAHGGTVSVGDTPGGGATFTVRLPCGR